MSTEQKITPQMVLKALDNQPEPESEVVAIERLENALRIVLNVIDDPSTGNTVVLNRNSLARDIATVLRLAVQ